MGTLILIGDVRARLREMASESIDCVVMSPPYWGLRDYGVEGQIGLEPTLGEHLAVMVDVMEDIRRVLKRTGTVWLNYGDCYATSANGRSAAATKALGTDDRTFRDKPFSTVQGKLKPKDLCMVPNRLAIALQEAGWWVRSEIIWAKPNPMPESINDRPGTSHEKIFLLTKSARYFYDAAAVRQGLADASVARLAQDVEGQKGSDRAHAEGRANGPMKAVGGGRKQASIAESAAKVGASSGRRMGGFNDRWDAQERAQRDSFKRVSKDTDGAHGQKPQSRPDREDIAYPRGEGRNLRNYEPAPVQVWPIATRPFSEAHFATFPPELATRCLLAGCPKDGKVLDPFGGAGTTALAANRLGLDCTIIELNAEYAALAQRRLDRDRGMFADVSVVAAHETALDLSSVEASVLAALATVYDEHFLCFRSLGSKTGLERASVRAACRSLKERGLAQYSSCLMTEDGSVGGAGYACTPAGAEAAAFLSVAEAA
ncbi:DNA-methyltransferase [Brevundimonas sp.]|uniref:DNA-methyltransferase n=1 Tax=Brevundimonas sp. TaxID=1871086 RepID=UPI002FC7992C